MKFLVTLIVLSTSLSLKAESTYSVDKAQLVFAAVAKNQETSEYLRLAQDIPNHSALNVDAKTFLSVVSKGATEIRAVVEQRHVKEKLENFVRANKLQQQMVGINYLSVIQRSYVNVLVLLELQRRIFSRNDLEVFGANTIKNLNLAINEAIQIQYRNAEANAKRVLIGNTAQRLKENFINAGLEYKSPPSQAERWINESGLLGDYVPPMTPHILLNKIANESFRKLSAKLSAVTACTAMFLT